MPKLIITKGLPASGKTTWAKGEVEKHPSKVKRVNKDDLRQMIHAGVWTKQLEKDIIATRDILVDLYLARGYDVIVDDTNLQPSHIPNLQCLADDYNAEFEIKDFTDVPLNECLRRNKERANFVPEGAIKRMHNIYLKQKTHVAQYAPPPYDPKLPNAIIVDIDGTLAHMDGRSPYDYSKVKTDISDPIIRQIVNRYHADGYYVIVCSGRTDDCRKETEDWLRDNFINYNAIYMRETGDSRKDSIVKMEIYENHIKPYYNVKFILDDRNQVVEMWRSLGLKVLQVADGDF